MSKINFKNFEELKKNILKSEDISTVEITPGIVRELCQEGAMLYLSLHLDKAKLKFSTIEEHYNHVKSGVDVDENTLLFCCLRHNVLMSAYKRVFKVEYVNRKTD